MRHPLQARRPSGRWALLSLLAATWWLAAPPAAAQDTAAPKAAAPQADDAPPATHTAALQADAPPAVAPQADSPPAAGSAPPTDGAAGAGAPSGGAAGAGGAGGAASDAGQRSAARRDRPGATSSRAAPSKKRRGDINPCMTPDPGWGVYDPWSRAPSIGQMIMPHRGGVTKRGGFDVIIHFHGHEALRKEFVKTAEGAVLVGIDLGIGSGAYSSAFSAPYVFENLLDSIERAVAKKTGKKKAYIRKLGLSSWSAGYGAIEQILRQPAGKRVDALVLLDSLHAGYADEQQHKLKVAQIEPFIAFARRAAAGEAFMFMSHSSILPPGYASTAETANFIVQQLRGKPRGSSRADVLGLDMIQRFDRGDFHVRGYTGDDKPDHCAHIGLMADVVRIHLNPRWKSPRGRR
ncbi:hypothetical protein [Sorangium atrum]|uniref:Uncharacterized protein n=1 Tax=Sorangium atrum TaxID=2995308 RepID=A0ABT5CB05_9BACT|nr:hypothetical protein [Sorangium aterium]MDC0683608.1 hypothetical protein [Sorangium aterium]